MPGVEIAVAILGSELIKTCWQGAVGNYVHEGCEWIRGKIPRGSPQSHDVLRAMHHCFRQSIQVMADACSTVDGANADARLARRKLGEYARSKALATLNLNTPDIPEDVLEAQIREIYERPTNGARTAATEQVIAFVELQIGCALTPSLRNVFHEGNCEVAPWAANFELLFAAEVKRNAEVRSILLFARANELRTLVEEASAQIEALFDHLDEIEARINKAFEEQHGRHDATQELIREGHRLNAGDIVDRVEAAVDIGALDSSQAERLRAITARIEAQIGTSNPATELAAKTAFRLEHSNDPALRAVAELINAGDLLGAAQLRAEAAEETLADGRIRAAAALREAGRLAAPLSPASSRQYFKRATEIDPEYVWGWIELGRLERDYHGIEAARVCFNTAIPRLKDDDSRAVLNDEIGNLERLSGDLLAARKHFLISHKIAEQQAIKNPQNLLIKRNFSVSYNRLGDIDFDIGDFHSAIANYKKSLDIRKDIASEEPNNIQWQHDLSHNHNKLGHNYAIAGDDTSAHSYFIKALNIREQLAKLEPDNSERQRNLAISYEMLGGVEQRLGNLKAAHRHFQSGHDIAERLSRREPGNIRWQHDLSTFCLRLGDVHSVASEYDNAREYYRTALDMRRRLTTLDPANSMLKRELAMNLGKLGDSERAKAANSEAGRHFEEARDIITELIKHDPNNIVWQHDMFVILVRLAHLHEGRGDRSGAIQEYELAQSTIAALVKRCQNQPSFVNDWLYTLAQLGRLRSIDG